MKLKISIVSLLAFALLSGCASERAALGGIAKAVTPAASQVVDTAVAIATTYELTRDPVTTKAKAVAFKAIAQQIVADTANPATTVAMLEATLNAKLVSLAPNPIVAGSAISLIGGIQGALDNVIGTATGAPLTQQTLVSLRGVAQQVVNVCAFYGG